MHRTYIITIIILIIALIVAIQNTTTVAINFLVWHFAQSQALTIIIIFFLGFISGWALQWQIAWRRNRQLKAANKKITELSKQQPPTPPSAR